MHEAQEIRTTKRNVTCRENKRALQTISDVRNALFERSGFEWKNLCWKNSRGKVMSASQYEFLQHQISEAK